MKEALDTLEGELIRRAPGVQQALRPGLSDAMIEEMLRPFAHAVPNQLRLFYRWHDGAELVKGWRAFLFPGARWLPLEEAVKTRDDALEGDRRTGRPVWDSRWLPIFTDGSDGYTVVVGGDRGGTLLNFFFVDLPDTWAEFNDLRSLVEALVRRWRAGAYWQGSTGAIEQDPRAVAALRRAADSKPPDIDQLVIALDEGSQAAYGQALLLLRLNLYPEAVPGLLRLLDAGTDQGRRSAAELLGLIGDPVAVGGLKAAASADRDEIVRMLARNALKDLDHTSGC